MHPTLQDITTDILLNTVNAPPVLDPSLARLASVPPGTSGAYAGTIPRVDQAEEVPPEVVAASYQNSAALDMRTYEDRVEGREWQLPEPNKPIGVCSCLSAWGCSLVEG